MRIRSLDIWVLNLTFRYPFRHKLATHAASQNLVVGVRTAAGLRGFGEGVPRSFVTGETLERSVTWLKETLGPAVLAHDFPTPEAFRPIFLTWWDTLGGEAAPGAFCALETALLDAAGRTFSRSLGEFLGPPHHAPLRYSAVLPLSAGPQLAQFFTQVKALGVGQVKLKVGEDNDLETLAQARRELGEEVDLRVDANGAWRADEAIRRIREMEPFRVSLVEQPVPKEDVEGLARVQEAVAVPVMADEAVCTLAEARRLIELRACRLFNLRLSKMGGLTQTRRIYELAREAGISCQLGCQVGETSILAAAGRHFACTTPGLAYLEGSYAPFLLREDPVATPLGFGPGGAAPPLTGPGLGLEVREDLLHQLATIHITIP
uniref:Enolase n=1 Tax=Desulfobacca acetoxidans TaxID=60893 RepID=A0A7V4LDI8_9BACT